MCRCIRISNRVPKSICRLGVAVGRSPRHRKRSQMCARPEDALPILDRCGGGAYSDLQLLANDFRPSNGTDGQAVSILRQRRSRHYPSDGVRTLIASGCVSPFSKPARSYRPWRRMSGLAHILAQTRDGRVQSADVAARQPRDSYPDWVLPHFWCNDRGAFEPTPFYAAINTRCFNRGYVACPYI